MKSILDVCAETNLNIDDIRLILADCRPDWAIAEQVTDSEANLIRQSAVAALPGSSSQITPVADMDITQQERLIDNASQILGFPLVLATLQEIKAIDALQQVKNAIALNAIDCRQAELDAAIQQRSQTRQDAYLVAIQDLANQMQKPISVVQEMTADIKRGNEQLDALLAQVKAGK